MASHPGCFRVQIPATLSISRALPILVALFHLCRLEQHWCPCLVHPTASLDHSECAAVWDGVAQL